MFGKDIQLHMVFPGLVGLICLAGIIGLTAAGMPVPNELSQLAVAFGAWAFGAGVVAAKTAPPAVKGEGKTDGTVDKPSV